MQQVLKTMDAFISIILLTGMALAVPVEEQRPYVGLESQVSNFNPSMIDLKEANFEGDHKIEEEEEEDRQKEQQFSVPFEKRAKIVQQLEEIGGGGGLGREQMNEGSMEQTGEDPSLSREIVKQAYLQNIEHLNTLVEEINGMVEEDRRRMDEDDDLNHVEVLDTLPSADFVIGRGEGDDDDVRRNKREAAAAPPTCVGPKCAEEEDKSAVMCVGPDCAEKKKRRRKRSIPGVSENSQTRGGALHLLPLQPIQQQQQHQQQQQQPPPCVGPNCFQRIIEVLPEKALLPNDPLRQQEQQQQQQQQPQAEQVKMSTPSSDFSDIKALERDAENLLRNIERRYNEEIAKLQMIDKKLHDLNQEADRKKQLMSQQQQQQQQQQPPKLPVELERRLSIDKLLEERKANERRILKDDNIFDKVMAVHSTKHEIPLARTNVLHIGIQDNEVEKKMKEQEEEVEKVRKLSEGQEQRRKEEAQMRKMEEIRKEIERRQLMAELEKKKKENEEKNKSKEEREKSEEEEGMNKGKDSGSSSSSSRESKDGKVVRKKKEGEINNNNNNVLSVPKMMKVEPVVAAAATTVAPSTPPK